MNLAMAPPMRRSASRWLGWVGLALAGLGYWGPWIWHPSAALTLIGLDLGEFVKFLPSVRSGQLTLHREIFFLPAAALSLNLTLIAYRRGSRLKWPGKIIASLGAIAIALAMLPPAWSPATLRLPEFRTLTILITLCVVFALTGPLWEGLPRRWLSGVALFFAALAIIGPLWQFWLALPAIQTAYGRPLTIGWGPVTMALGWLLFAASEGLQMTQHGREGNSTGYVKHSD
jgi:hypothetical protein